MKTAVSIPDEVFADAERLARRLKKSRSELYSNALREYVARHSGDDVTETLDEVCSGLPAEEDAFVREASRRRLKRVKW